MNAFLGSSNEWDPLREVVVGSVANFHMKSLDNMFLYIYGQLRNFQEKSFLRKKYVIYRKYIIERQEDLSNIEKVLRKNGVAVRKTSVIDSKRIVTSYFSSIMNDCGCVRDMFSIIGDKIIETPPTDRRRYFEGMALREIFLEYCKQGAQWIVAPRTSLTDKSVDFKEWNKCTSNFFHKIDEIENKYEIAFDAANILRFDKDIIMNIGNKNHELGAYWMQKMLGKDYIVHKVRLTDSHIDGLFMPIDKGVLLVNDKAMKDKWHLLPDFLKKWKRISVLDTYVEFNYPKNHFQLSSFRGMDVNVLPLGNKKILIRNTAVKTIKKLKEEGFIPIPVRLRHCELFGGGPHCITLDTMRES